MAPGGLANPLGSAHLLGAQPQPEVLGAQPLPGMLELAASKVADPVGLDDPVRAVDSLHSLY